MSIDPGPRPYPWLLPLWRSLSVRAHSGRLPHALLFAGAEGIGKRELAELLARTLLCESGSEEGPCGYCRSCHLYAAGSHPDLLRILPLEEGKALTIDQVREAAAYQALKPHYADRKVILVSPADRMNDFAANALLKTLEEPTPGTLLILLTSRPAALLPTIRSRCQTVRFELPQATPDLLSWMGERVPGHDPALLLALSGGAPLRAVGLAEEKGESLRIEVLERLEQLIQGRISPTEAAERWVKIGAGTALSWGHSLVCDLIRFKSSGDFAYAVHKDLLPRLQQMATSVDLQGLFRMLDRLQEGLRLLQANASAQLLLEEILIHWLTLSERRTHS